MLIGTLLSPLPSRAIALVVWVGADVVSPARWWWLVMLWRVWIVTIRRELWVWVVVKIITMILVVLMVVIYSLHLMLRGKGSVQVMLLIMAVNLLNHVRLIPCIVKW